MNIHKMIFLKDLLNSKELSYLYDIFVYDGSHGHIDHDVIIEKNDLLSSLEESANDPSVTSLQNVTAIIKKLKSLPDDVKYISYYIH